MPSRWTLIAAGSATIVAVLLTGSTLLRPASSTEAPLIPAAELDLAQVALPDIQVEPLAITIPAPAEPAPVVDTPKGLQVQKYTVRSGDTVHGLAERFDISAETIVWANDLADADILSVGDTLEIPPVTGVLHRVRPGDTVAELISFYGGAIRDVLDVNRLAPPFIIVVGQPLMIPNGKVPPPVPPGAVTESEQLPPLPVPPTATEDQRTFIMGHARAAQRSQKNTGIPASVTLAQAILETYWGTSRLSREAHNYFGIKAREEPGPAGVVTFNVWEHVNGRDIYSNEPFRRYHNAEESFTDHGKWFHTWPRYANALAVRHDPKAFARAINAAGYATDPAYATKLISLMDKFNLYAYDL